MGCGQITVTVPTGTSVYILSGSNSDFKLFDSENCDPSRDYTGISTLLTENGATATLDYMQTYWVNDDGTSEELWEHEWATHGTCYSTLEPSCFGSDYYTGEEAVAFYQTVVALFQVICL